MKIEKIITTNSITFARALLALGFLCTLLFTPIDELFPKSHIDKFQELPIFFKSINYFLWFDNINIPYYLSVIIFIVSISGFFPRYISILQCLATYSCFYSFLIVEGGDQISAILTLLIIPICILDKRVNGWVNKEDYYKTSKILTINAKWAILLIYIQMSVLYFNAGTSKMYQNEWSNGTVIYYWINDDLFGPSAFLKSILNFFLKSDFIVFIITWGVMIFEIALGFLVFFNQKTKYIFYPFAILFHLSIAFIFGLSTFFIAMSSGLTLLLFNLEISFVENFREITKVFKQTIFSKSFFFDIKNKSFH